MAKILNGCGTHGTSTCRNSLLGSAALASTALLRADPDSGGCLALGGQYTPLQIYPNPAGVLSVNGLFDLATPFFITEYDLAHMELEPKLRGNIELPTIIRAT